jgi:class 3 adenylate cyclase
MLAAHPAILESAILRHRGRIANIAGDSVLAEFPSAVNAVQCAVDVANVEPLGNSTRRSAGALSAASRRACCASTAQCTTFIALGNSANPIACRVRNTTTMPGNVHV